MATMQMQTPQDLFMHELSAQLSAERGIETMLAEARGLVQTPQILQGIEHHLHETQEQASNLQQAIQLAGGQAHEVHCHTVDGMMQDLHEALAANPSPMVIEGLILCSAAKTEHMEIAAYTSLIEKANAMGMSEISILLQQNLKQEQ